MPESINNLVSENKFWDGQVIPNKEALQLIKNYKETSGWGINKTRGIWFSTDELKTIIKMIEQISNGDGVRIYLARYAPDQTGIPEEYKSRETLVYVPTTIKVTPTGFAHVNVINVEALLGTTNTTMDDGGDGGDDGYNHGELCPPKCG